MTNCWSLVTFPLVPNLCFFLIIWTVSSGTKVRLNGPCSNTHESSPYVIKQIPIDLLETVGLKQLSLQTRLCGTMRSHRCFAFTALLSWTTRGDSAISCLSRFGQADELFECHRLSRLSDCECLIDSSPLRKEVKSLPIVAMRLGETKYNSEQLFCWARTCNPG